MNKREYAKLKKWTDTLTDEELKKEYYDAVFDKGFQRYLETFGEVECASGGKGQTLNKIFTRCLREINRNY